jgi:cell wall-associated NlpC family hydrolase
LPDIAGLALKYQGAGYVFGGSPASGIGNWDCSSFVNWVVGHDAGMAIPGYAAGTYTGSGHGPVVLDWATWSGATGTSSPMRGDICVWAGVGASGHMGIFLAANQMISALNSAQGTIVSPIQGYGPSGIPIAYRALTGNTSGGVSITGCNPVSTPVAGLILMRQIWLRTRTR